MTKIEETLFQHRLHRHLNELRCHDDIGWGLDFDTLKQWGFEEVAHKKYLNQYFQGYEGGSNSRGELYNDDPTTGDDAVLAIGRYADAEKIIGVFNFSEFDKPLSLLYDKGDFTDLLTGAHYTLNEQTALRVPAYGSFYLQQQF